MNASLIRIAPVGILVALSAGSAGAQDLARRVTAATAPNVQFHFAARPGVCGDGRTYIRTDTDSWYGSINDFTRSQPCAEGPVRVVVVRSDREPIRIEAFAGTLQNDSTASDLGRVAAADAANYLMSLARTAEGRVGREALMPATLADSATIAPALLAIARDQSRSRDMRRSALGWLSRRSTTRDGLAAPELIRTLGDFARDETEHNTFRQSAVSLLGRRFTLRLGDSALEHGDPSDFFRKRVAQPIEQEVSEQEQPG